MDDKLPHFLVKLWSILTDDSLSDIIRWDPSGKSFHVVDAYNFCRVVLPQYFKHNNLNSFVRQLNLYGFRKINNLERNGLVYASADSSDDMHFGHPLLFRGRPDLLVNIKRNTASTKRQPSTAGGSPEKTVTLPEKDLLCMLEELQSLREGHAAMESDVCELAKENEQLWEEVVGLHSDQQRQRQNLSKLVQFLISVVRPQKRMGKRIVPIDEHSQPYANARSVALMQSQNCDVLDYIQRDLTEGLHVSSQSSVYKRTPGATAQRILDRQDLPSRKFSAAHGDTRPVEVQSNNVMGVASQPVSSSASLAACTSKAVAVRPSNQHILPAFHRQGEIPKFMLREIDDYEQCHVYEPSTSSAVHQYSENVGDGVQPAQQYYQHNEAANQNNMIMPHRGQIQDNFDHDWDDMDLLEDTPHDEEALFNSLEMHHDGLPMFQLGHEQRLQLEGAK
jgi:hypothetical protein